MHIFLDPIYLGLRIYPHEKIINTYYDLATNTFIIALFKKYGTLHKFACHPCTGALLIFSVLFQI